ncbi:MAG: hypothetical protein UJ210_05860 [Massilimicrobiota sp.]|nr:hypothetical protein [Massilimicrobiota sp.]
MNKKFATFEFVQSIANRNAALGMNTLGNAIRIGIQKDGADKAAIFIFGTHNAEPFISLVRVSWNSSDISYSVNNIVGTCNIRYTEMQQDHVVVDIITSIYGCAYVMCTNAFYASFLGVN